MSRIPVIDHDAVLRALSATDAIECVADGFVRYQRGEWRMPPKVYLDSAPYGDFRAMPAGNDDVAVVKWVTSFPGNTARGLPAVTGLVCVSDARTGLPRMLIDARPVTALRTGAAAAVATRALARPDARTVGVIGCGVHGGWVARCLGALGYGPGVCADPHQAAADALAAELGWRGGSVTEAADCDVVCCVTPAHVAVLTADVLAAGQHLNLMGADGPGKAEATVDVVARCALFCDDWAQASHSGELAGAVGAGLIQRSDVGDLGAVLTGQHPGRPSAEAVTLFDSTGLAIQDLAIAAALLARYQAGNLEAQFVDL